MFLSPPVQIARWTPMHAFCLSVCIKNSLLEKDQISEGTVPRVMKFGRGIDLHDLSIDLEGHRSNVKVTRSKHAVFFCTFHSPTGTLLAA